MPDACVALCLAGRPLAAHGAPQGGQLDMDSQASIGVFRGAMDLADALEERRITPGAGRWRPALPRMVLAGGDVQQSDIVAIEYMARLALANSKTSQRSWAGSSRSLERTRRSSGE